PLPDDPGEPPDSVIDHLTGRLRDGWGFEVPVFSWPQFPRRVIRVSAQRYNHLEQYRRLAEAVTAELGAPWHPAA
ncbi:MAG: aminotransferase class V-fold PLP-dependent enzyme, partial [Acidimicrobiia bacterium]